MSNKFWNDRNADAPVRWGWVLAIVIGALVGIYAASCGQELHCDDADRNEKRERAGHPHDDTGRRLVG